MTGSRDIPCLDLGGDGPDLHFAHANGFPVETYRVLLDDLGRDYRVFGMNQRPLWDGEDPARLNDWHRFVDDLIDFLDENVEAPIVGVGHSLGGVVTALASVRRPDLFSAIALIDPVFLPPQWSLIWKTIKALHLGHRLPLVRGAMRRKADWPSREEALERYREAPAFARFDPRVLADYVEHGFVDNNGYGVSLRYPAVWEAWVFENTPHDHWPQIAKISTPCLIVRGEESDTLVPASWRRLHRMLPEARFHEIQGAGHLVPMEKPGAVADAVRTFLRDLRVSEAPLPSTEERRALS